MVSDALAVKRTYAEEAALEASEVKLAAVA
jgi:hypothetical protein